jgi:hypothetical protein
LECKIAVLNSSQDPFFIVQVRLLGDKTPSIAVLQNLRLIRYSYFGTYATLPDHEGNERE